MPRAAFRQSDLERALKTARAAGLTVVGCDISDGRISLSFGETSTADAALERNRPLEAACSLLP